MSLSFDCMSEDELAGWLEAAMRYNHGRGNPIPCTDCPLEYRLVELAAGRCNRVEVVELRVDWAYTSGVGSSDYPATISETPFGSLTLSGGVSASRGQG